MSKAICKAVAWALVLASGLGAQEAAGWIHRVDGNVYRGKQPGKADIPELAGAGIKTVLDLRGTLDHKGWEKAAVQAAGMQYVRIGLSGVFPPTQHQMDQILAVLEDPARGPVFVHCRRGADRSGEVIACYRIAHDHWSNAQALQEAREHGLSRLEVLMQQYIRRFSPTPAAPAVQGGQH